MNWNNMYKLFNPHIRKSFRIPQKTLWRHLKGVLIFFETLIHPFPLHTEILYKTGDELVEVNKQTREACSKSCQIYKIRWRFFAKIIKSFQPLAIFAKSSILDVWQCFEYASELEWHSAEENSCSGSITKILEQIPWKSF